MGFWCWTATRSDPFASTISISTFTIAAPNGQAQLVRAAVLQHQFGTYSFGPQYSPVGPGLPAGLDPQLTPSTSLLDWSVFT